eukprot:PhM_4_TR15250/c0_g1_i1/m.25247
MQYSTQITFCECVATFSSFEWIDSDFDNTLHRLRARPGVVFMSSVSPARCDQNHNMPSMCFTFHHPLVEKMQCELFQSGEMVTRPTQGHDATLSDVGNAAAVFGKVVFECCGRDTEQRLFRRSSEIHSISGPFEGLKKYPSLLHLFCAAPDGAVYEPVVVDAVCLPDTLIPPEVSLGCRGVVGLHCDGTVRVWASQPQKSYKPSNREKSKVQAVAPLTPQVIDRVLQWVLTLDVSSIHSDSKKGALTPT